MNRGKYTYYAVELTTGRVVTELPIATFSGERHLQGGIMQATMTLTGLERQRRRDLLAVTTPGKYSLVADRNGMIVGEWIIWRSQPDGLTSEPIPLMGQELISFLATQPIPTNSFVSVDQFNIARWMLEAGFWPGGSSGVGGSLAIDIPYPGSTGRYRDRSYAFADAPVAQRLEELSQVIDGFDYWVDSEWDRSEGFLKVKRTARLGYPVAGRNTNLVFDQAPPVWRNQEMTPGSGGSITEFRPSYDGTLLGSRAIAICAGKGEGRVLGIAEDMSLVDEGYPYMTVSRSWTSVTRQPTADSHAQALLTNAQIAEVPPAVTVLADGDPALGDWLLGDRVRIKVKETTNLPDGYNEMVRILGWVLQPTIAGPETVRLSVTSLLTVEIPEDGDDDDDGGDDGGGILT